MTLPERDRKGKNEGERGRSAPGVWDVFFDAQSSRGIGEGLAVGVEEVRFDETAEGDDVFSTGAEPAHAGEFRALTGIREGATTSHVKLSSRGRFPVELWSLHPSRVRTREMTIEALCTSSPR